MADIFEIFGLFDLLLSWRFWVCAAIGIGAGFAIYALGGESQVAAIAGFAAGGTGVVLGFLWQIRHDRHS